MGLTTHLLKRKGSYKKNKNPIHLMGYTTQFIEKESKISHLFIFIHSIEQITINHKFMHKFNFIPRGHVINEIPYNHRVSTPKNRT